MPASLIGTDLTISNLGFKEGAVELLAENGIDNFLEEEDFVFMMHQGYIFWYFKADGSLNPEVHGFSEVNNERKSFGCLSDFLSHYY
jgi:hypothetical protein